MKSKYDFFFRLLCVVSSSVKESFTVQQKAITNRLLLLTICVINDYVINYNELHIVMYFAIIS